jgi:hypothetical protein
MVLAGSEAPVRLYGTNYLAWTNTTWRQWVGSVVCSYLTNTPSSTVTISIIDSSNVVNVIASGTSTNFQTMAYVSERGPLVVNKGDVVRITETASSSFGVTLNNLMGE